MNGNDAARRMRVPRYAVDLLYAAKLVAHPPVNATPELLGEYQAALVRAVSAFEEAMPVKDGVIQESES